MAIETTGSGPGRTVHAGDLGVPEAVAATLRREREARLSWPDLYHLQRLAEGGLLAAGLAHDVGNLLSAISGWCQIAATAPDPERRAEAAARAGELATRTGAKVKTFLTFARAYVPPACRVALAEVLGDAVALVRTARPGLEVRWKPPEGRLPALLGPRTLLLQAYLTVMLQLTLPEPGRSRSLHVRAEPRATFARVEVDEQGPRLRDPVYLALPRAEPPARPLPDLDRLDALVRDLGGRLGSEPLVPHGVRVWIELPAARDLS